MQLFFKFLTRALIFEIGRCPLLCPSVDDYRTALIELGVGGEVCGLMQQFSTLHKLNLQMLTKRISGFL
jgi:hypothetical protein